FFGQLGVGAASLAGLASGSAAKGGPAKEFDGRFAGASPRASQAFELRMRAAELARDRAPVAQTGNGEEDLYPSRIASISKGLPHNAYGEVDPAAYDAYLHALNSGNQAALDSMPMGLGRRLTNPLAGLAFDLEGPDGHHLAQPPAPTIASGQGGSELGELYWAAGARHAHFSDYGTSAVIADAAADLSRFPDFRGPKASGQVTPGTIFRGSTAGDLIGPYLSQFLWQGFHKGGRTGAQRG